MLCASLPLLRPLVLVLKQLLASAGLSNPNTLTVTPSPRPSPGPTRIPLTLTQTRLSCGFRGGLSSYALVLMATSTLQQPSSLGGERHGVGPLLQRFLQARGAVRARASVTF